MRIQEYIEGYKNEKRIQKDTGGFSRTEEDI